MEYQTILVNREGPLFEIVLNRPEVLNAINATMDEELSSALWNARLDKGVRVIVIRGSGRAFTAGQDVRDFAEAYSSGKSPDFKLGLQRRKRVFTLIREIPKPVLAGINGVVAGIGLSLALVCDIRVAAKSARFIPAFARIGLVPDGGLVYLLSKYMPVGKLFDFYAMNREISAEEAYRMGLVEYLVDDAAFLDELKKIALKYAEGPTYAFGLTKQIVNMTVFADYERAFDVEMELQEKAAVSQDHREGVRAFVEKRQPVFRGE